LFYRSDSGVVMCQQRLLLICDFGEALVQHRSDAGVKVALPAAHEGFTGSILKQRLAEKIDSSRRRAATVKKV
jgi:hypothetical protein